MMNKITTVLAALLIVFGAAAQETAQETESQDSGPSGLTFGAFPIFDYNPDMGFRLGGRAVGYDFGKGRVNYPNPRQQLYVEASGYTNKAQVYALSYDNRFLVPGIRFTFAAGFSDERAFDFYGFGGYESYYDRALPRAYYQLDRKMPWAKLDFTGKIVSNLYWKFGYHFKYFILNETESESLSEVPFGKSLFSWYKSLGFIEGDEFNGGMTSALRAGLSWDNRDCEADPSRGNWTDAFMEWAPKWMGTNKPYGRYHVTVRQYVPLSGDRLVFAARANVQGFIGKPGFYVLPSESGIGSVWDRDGFGGYGTLRGILRNRLQGQSLCYFNTELRWKFLTTELLGQDLSFGANVFFEGGRVLKNYTDVSVDAQAWQRQLDKIPAQLLQGGREKFHFTTGAGVRAILNRNFIISLDYGHAFNTQDCGRWGALYFNAGYLF